MERYGRIWGTFLTACIFLGSCTDLTPIAETSICVELGENDVITRSYDPDEELIKDISLLVFDEEGNLEFSRYTTGINMTGRKFKLTVPLLMNKKYSFYACANFGHAIKSESITDIRSLKWYLVYPDEYREGIAMAGMAENVPITGTAPVIRIPLKRLMAKITMQIDRSHLDENVKMYVTSVNIGNCPKSSYVFRQGKAEDHDECFNIGFSRDEAECTVLNTNSAGGKSGSLSLYMLENMQGKIHTEDISEDKDKILDSNDPRRETASYLELRMDYDSPVCHTTSTPLIYRLYLGKDRNSLDIERNTHYHITVIPENDGLKGDGWRVDKNGIESYSTGSFFKMTPSGYMQGDIGDTVRIRCSYSPPDTPFDIGLEELEYDKGRGIYDYKIDNDSHGVSLILKSPGTGIIYMSAGAPINESRMLVIEVNLPKTN